MNRRYFVYILTNRPRGVLYIGVTNDLIRRLSEHKGKLVPGFTRAYGVIMLVYYEEYSSILEALTSLSCERCSCPGRSQHLKDVHAPLCSLW